MRFLTSLMGVAVLWTLLSNAEAAEGFWGYEQIPLDLMQAMGGANVSRPTLDHLRLSTLRQPQWCSYSFVSPHGLILTNQHCLMSCLQPTAEDKTDVVESGFYAASEDADRKCPDIVLHQLTQIVDVTELITKQLVGLSDADYGATYSRIRNSEETSCKTTPATECNLVSRFHGLKYYLYKSKVYHDIRLVFAPEQSIASFGLSNGADQYDENHVLDVAFLRAYDDNKPVDSIANYLPISKQKVLEGDFVMLSGNPQQTERRLTTEEASLERSMVMAQAFYLAELRGYLRQVRLTEPSLRSPSQSTNFNVTHTYYGLREQLDSLDGFARTNAQLSDGRLIAATLDKPDLSSELQKARLGLDTIAQDAGVNYQAYMIVEDPLYSFVSKEMRLARDLVRAAAEKLLPDEDRLPEYTKASLPSVERRLFAAADINKDLEIAYLAFAIQRISELSVTYRLDVPVLQGLGEDEIESLARRLIRGSQIGQSAFRKALYLGGASAVAASTDPLVAFFRDVIDPVARKARKEYENNYSLLKDRYLRRINDVRIKTESHAQYPDADSTLRLSFGRVEGINVDRKQLPAFTTIGDIFKLANRSAAYKLPDSWITAKAQLDSNAHFSFLANTDSVGGNSGSSIVNSRGDVVGILWGGIGHDMTYAYNSDTTRSECIDIVTVMTLLRTVYKTNRLLTELGE